MKPTKQQRRAKKLKTAQKVSATEQNELNRQRKNVQVPEFITCNECGGRAEKSTFVKLDTSGMKGINLALSGICSDCGRPTIAICGDPEAAASVMSAFQEEIGGGILGFETHSNT